MVRKIIVGSLCLVLAAAVVARAENEGQEDLDKATELQLRVQSLRDAEQVVKLCESALAKGLDENNTTFAKQLLVSALWRHASQLSEVILNNAQPDPRWRQIRRLIINDLEKLLKHDPSFADAHILSAKMQVLPGGNIEQARSSIDKAVELFADDKTKRSEAIVLRAQIQQDPDKQLADLNQAVEIDPTNQKAWQARAVYFITRGQLDKAAADFEKILEREPNNIDIRHALAESLSNLEKHDLAMEQVNKAIEIQPEVADSFTLRARIHERKNDLKAAIADLGKALELEPEDPVALFTRARLHLLQDELKEAREDLTKFLQFRPDNAQGILLRSMIAAEERNFAEAVSDLQLLLRSDPENVELRMQLGAFYVADQRPRKAIEVFTSILEDHKEHWGAYRARGDALLSVGKHQEAIADYEAGLKLKEDDEGILNNLAWVLATSPMDDVRNAERALELAKKACEVTEYKKPHILSTLAAAHAEGGNFEEAIKWSTKAVELGREELKEQIQQLEQELESYKNNKPWRELQKVEDKPDPPRRVIDT